MNGPAYIHSIPLTGHASPREQAHAIGESMIVPCRAADAELDEIQRLKFWAALIAYLLGVAEASIGAEGRMAVVQTMRNVPPSGLMGMQ